MLLRVGYGPALWHHLGAWEKGLPTGLLSHSLYVKQLPLAGRHGKEPPLHVHRRRHTLGKWMEGSKPLRLKHFKRFPCSRLPVERKELGFPKYR